MSLLLLRCLHRKTCVNDRALQKVESHIKTNDPGGGKVVKFSLVLAFASCFPLKLHASFGVICMEGRLRHSLSCLG